MSKFHRTGHLDDLTGMEIPPGETVVNRTITFQGKRYTLDLTEDSARTVDDTINSLVSGSGVMRLSNPKESGEPSMTAKIREWAREQGMDVADRGRLSPAIVSAYQDAHSEASAPASEQTETDPAPRTRSARRAKLEAVKEEAEAEAALA